MLRELSSSCTTACLKAIELSWACYRRGSTIAVLCC